MAIDIDTIIHLTSHLLSKLKETKGGMVELKNDYYWNIPNEQLYNPYNNPSEFSLGQLSDDLNEIYRLRNSPEGAVSYDLKRIAEIIKALSIENPTDM